MQKAIKDKLPSGKYKNGSEIAEKNYVVNIKPIGLFDGKLISLEVHDTPFMDEKPNNLAQEIEEYPELKESLQRFLDNPDMKRYTAEELKGQFHQSCYLHSFLCPKVELIICIKIS
ncbi:hypothetical protein EWI07_07445 [Sporolactobacillus sp. THM7-4]|nr:hypothetical protein EWI07_07445 [Sporolactobacillus sp. THM7-4]